MEAPEASCRSRRSAPQLCCLLPACCLPACLGACLGAGCAARGLVAPGAAPRGPGPGVEEPRRGGGPHPAARRLRLGHVCAAQRQAAPGRQRAGATSRHTVRRALSLPGRACRQLRGPEQAPAVLAPCPERAGWPFPTYLHPPCHLLLCCHPAVPSPTTPAPATLTPCTAQAACG